MSCQIFRFLFLILLLLIVAALGISVARAEDNVAEVVVMNLQAIRELCWRPDDPAMDGGCNQSLAREDYLRGWRRNWASRDFLNGRGPYRDFDLCNGPTRWSGRSMYRVETTSGMLVFIRQRVRPPEAVGLFELHRYYVNDEHCWPDSAQTMPAIPGAYAREFVFPERNVLGAFPSRAELSEVEYLPDLWTLAEYWDAYYAVAEGLLLVQGSADNPYQPWTREAQRYAWDNREAIFHLMADGPATDEHARVAVWHTCKRLSELVILCAAFEEGDWYENQADLIERGWPTGLTRDLDPALDVIYRGTGSAGDPYRIFDDADVTVEETTVGGVKRRALEGLR